MGEKKEHQSLSLLPSVFVIRRGKKRFSKSKGQPECKKCLKPTPRGKVYNRIHYGFSWMVKELIQHTHQKCLNLMTKIKLIACWNSQEVGLSFLFVALSLFRDPCIKGKHFIRSPF